MRGPFRLSGRVRPGLLVLSGLDGSGKSTQAAILSERLGREGVPVETVWNRWEPRISAPLIRLAKRKLSHPEGSSPEDYGPFTAAKQQAMKSPLKRSLWQLMVWSEYSVQVNLRLLRHRSGGGGVICDRYVYDTIIDVALNFSLPPDRIEELCNHLLLSLFPRPGGVVFFDIDPESGSSRKNDGTPAAYLADRRAYYTVMAGLLGAPVIDAGKPIEDVAESLWLLTEDWRKGLPGRRPG
jgi:dTMP kinase